MGAGASAQLPDNVTLDEAKAYAGEGGWNEDAQKAFDAAAADGKVSKDAISAYEAEQNKAATKLQAARREQQERDVGRLLQVAIAGRKRLTTHQLDLLVKEAEKDGIGQNVVDGVVERLGVKIEAGDSADSSTPGLPYKTPSMDATVLGQINNWLKVLDKESLYALLDMPARTSAARLVAVAEKMYERWCRAFVW